MYLQLYGFPIHPITAEPWLRLNMRYTYAQSGNSTRNKDQPVESKVIVTFQTQTQSVPMMGYSLHAMNQIRSTQIQVPWFLINDCSFNINPLINYCPSDVMKCPVARALKGVSEND